MSQCISMFMETFLYWHTDLELGGLVYLTLKLFIYFIIKTEKHYKMAPIWLDNINQLIKNLGLTSKVGDKIHYFHCRDNSKFDTVLYNLMFFIFIFKTSVVSSTLHTGKELMFWVKGWGISGVWNGTCIDVK